MERNRAVIFGGTWEGRMIAETFQKTKLELHICVATEYGASLLPVCENIHVHAGRMDQEEMEAFLAGLKPDCCLDATHPYAAQVTENISKACQSLSLCYVRVRRHEAAAKGAAAVIYRESIAAAVEYLSDTKGNILITTGSRDLEEYTKLPDYKSRCFARVLPTLSVMEKCRALGFEGRNLIGMQGPFSEELNLAMLKQTNAAWMVTKNSGKEGGYPEKCEAAIRAGANIVVIGRPAEKAENVMSLEEAAAYLRRRYKMEAVDGSGEAKEPPGLRRQVYLVGMGPGQQELLTQQARDCLEKCDVLIGAKRILKIWKGYENKPFYDCYRKQDICAFLREHPEYKRAAVVYSGDIGFYSGAKGMRELLPEFEVHPVSGLSSPLYFLNRLGIPWEDAALVSCHGQNGHLFSKIRSCSRVCALLGARDDVSQICKKLLENGMEEVFVTVGERLSYEEERIVSGTPRELVGREFDTLSVALFENAMSRAERISPGMKDEAFIRGRVPMTKEEIRMISLAKLSLGRDSVVYDVGAGTGSVSVEAALLCSLGRVYAIEKKAEAVALLEENKRKFAAENMEIIEGCAPDCLEGLEAPTHVFIGGSSGRLLEIIQSVRRKNERARFVINAVTLETLAQAERIREAFPEYEDMEVVSVNVSRARALGGYHLMTAENPVFVISFGSGGAKDER